MNGAVAYDLAPTLGILLTGLVLALGPLLWFWMRRRGSSPSARLRALALLTLFLSFDLVLLGAYTRLSDSGLGCPDWPGCYGHASPVGAGLPIAAAEAAVPTGAVTTKKAWIEMAHRYSATAIGVLVLVLAALAAFERHRRLTQASPNWAILTVLWIVAQGAFGALTVTMRLYPGIVTLHLLGGYGLLALLAIQAEAYEPRRITMTRGLGAAVAVVAALAFVQLVLGGWVSTNYAVLACRDFPTCQGSWWPQADFGEGFAVLRPLGTSVNGGFLPFPALTAIHLAHRIGAAVVVPALVWLAARLWASGGADTRRWALAVLAVAAWQVATGLSNVLLGWPLVAAVAHTAGGGALVVVLTVLLVRSRPWRKQVESASPAIRLGAAS